MALMDFIKKQFIDILQWTEEGDGTLAWRCLLYTFDAADERSSVDLGGRRIIKKKTVVK